MKTCSKCGVNFDSRVCVPCKKVSDAERYILKKASIDARNKEYYAKNKEKIAIIEREYRSAHKAERKDRAAKYYAQNVAKIAEVGAAYRKANKEKRAARAAARYAAAPELHRARNAAWGLRNRLARRIAAQNRRAKKRQAGGQLSKDISAKLYRLQRGKCACCRLPLGTDYHLDHKMPIALGGTNADSNMQLLRAVCNLQKGAKHPVDFMRSRGYLL